MWRVRGRAQLTGIAMIVVTFLFILYRISAGGYSSNAEIAKSPYNLQRSGQQLEDINQFSSLTQSPEHIARQKAYEARIMADVNGDHVGGRHLMLPGDNQPRRGGKIGKPLFSGQRVVHLDLKGAPPRISYYEELFPLLHSLGATGLLIEYEDMFPYTGLLQDLPAYNAYSRSELRRLLKLAADNHLEVIPLIQTFGHMEFVLKLQQYAHLREVPRYPQVVCPSHNSTFPLLTAMVDQIVTMHPGIRYLHIGCDEVYYLAECVRCALAMVEHKWGKARLFLEHVARVARYVREHHPGVTPLTWDDEFRELPEQEIQDSGVAQLVEPVVWKYTPEVSTYIPSEVWEKYATLFPAVWVATAFKGATGPKQFLPDISYHMDNHRAWMEVVAAQSHRINFRGVMLTGWQRYDHFSVLCELLPVGVPSLAIALWYLQSDSREFSSVPRQVMETLKCDPPLPLSPGAGRAHCSYPGSSMLDCAERLYALNSNVERMLSDSTVKGWLSPYNVEHAFSSPSHVEHATTDLDRCRAELAYIERDMRSAMSDVYDRHTVTEWVTTHIRPLQGKLQVLWDARERLLARENWPKRPLDMGPV